MTISHIEERIAKAKEKIEKKNATIAKKNKMIAKMYDLLEKNGFSYDVDFGVLYEQNRDLYDKVWNMDYLAEDTLRLEKEIKNIQNTISKYEEMLVKEIARLTDNEKIPDVLLQLKDNLEEEFYESQIKRRNFLMEEYKKLGYSAFIRKYRGAYGELFQDDAEIEKDAKMSAEYFVEDIWRRTREEIGEMTDFSNVHVSGHALNGVFVGTEGKCSVETIVAGGYNIQREHLRAIIHKM